MFMSVCFYSESKHSLESSGSLMGIPDAASVSSYVSVSESPLESAQSAIRLKPEVRIRTATRHMKVRKCAYKLSARNASGEGARVINVMRVLSLERHLVGV